MILLSLFCWIAIVWILDLRTFDIWIGLIWSDSIFVMLALQLLGVVNFDFANIEMAANGEDLETLKVHLSVVLRRIQVLAGNIDSFIMDTDISSKQNLTQLSAHIRMK